MLGFDADGDPIMSASTVDEIDGAVDIISSSTTSLTNVVSVAALRLLGSAITDNDSITVLGYYAEGDGGGGTFYWDATSTATDNGGTIFKAAPTTGRWLRVYSGAVSVKWFGVIGDGVTDDYAALQGLFDIVDSDTYITFEGCDTVLISQPVYIVRDKDWSTGHTKTDRSNITLDLAGCEIKLDTTVPFFGIFTYPSYRRSNEELPTYTRSPQILTLSLDGITVKNGTLNGNMQARAAALGNPGVTEFEHALCFISAKDVIVDNLITQDTMGDGIIFVHPWSRATGTCGLYGRDSLDGNCEDIKVNNIKAFRHSRNGISLIGVINGIITNVYAEYLDSITNFKSLAGPGAVIDLEYNATNSYYDGLGYEVVENIHVEGVVGVHCEYGGAVQVMGAKDCVLTDISHFGPANVGIVTTTSNAENITFSNISVFNTSGVGSGTMLRLQGGTNITVDGLYASNVHGYSIMRVENDVTCSISNVHIKDHLFGDYTNYPITIIGNNTVKLSNINITARTASTLYGIFAITNDNNITVDNFTFSTVDDNIFYLAVDHPLFYFLGQNNTLDIKNVDIDTQVTGLLSLQTSTEIANVVHVDTIRLKGCAWFPANSAVEDLTVHNATVDSAYNVSSGDESLLNIICDDNTSVEIVNYTGYSTGRYGFNKCTTAVLIRTDNASFASLSGFSCKLKGLDLHGGRASDDTFTVLNWVLGVHVQELLTNTTARELFKTTDININDFKNTKHTLAAGSTVYDSLDFNLNMGALPNQSFNMELIDQLPEFPSVVKEWYKAGNPAHNSTQITFSGTLTVPHYVRIK
jgi:hypothetical protein